MLGPIFMRELVTVPRRASHYGARAALVGLQAVLGITAWQATVGFARDATLGEAARFGLLLFQILVYVQLLLLIFFAALSAAGAVSQEKDRRTFVLLLAAEAAAGKVSGKKFLPASIPDERQLRQQEREITGQRLVRVAGLDGAYRVAVNDKKLAGAA